jgi:BirA family transcriptional regulator, biotin operon repressor / biotin---[acetyl-CoA-carboxylase] ligase
MGGMSATGEHAAAVRLSAAGLRAAAVSPGGLWTDISVLAETGSTNADLLAAAGRGAPEGLVLAAETQTDGRGRLGRAWLSVPEGALTFSVLLRPRSVPQAARSWLPLLAGVAVASALRRVPGVDARLKWPNDVLVNDSKLAGILAEQSGDAIVVGVGINVRARQQDLPIATAISLELLGAGDVDRSQLLAAVLGEIERWYRRWTGARPGDADSCGLRQAYLRLSATAGRPVQVQLPGGRLLTGIARDVDAVGRLLVESAGGLIAVSAGDVIHVR